MEVTSRRDSYSLVGYGNQKSRRTARALLRGINGTGVIDAFTTGGSLAEHISTRATKPLSVWKATAAPKSHRASLSRLLGCRARFSQQPAVGTAFFRNAPPSPSYLVALPRVHSHAAPPPKGVARFRSCLLTYGTCVRPLWGVATCSSSCLARASGRLTNVSSTQ